MVAATFGTDNVGLRYDPLGRLYEVVDANGNIRRLYYDGVDLMIERDGSGNMFARYVHGAGGDDTPRARRLNVNSGPGPHSANLRRELC